LDCSSVKYTRSMRSVEWFNAHCHLATMVGSSPGRTVPFTAGRNLRSSLLQDGWLSPLGAF
jgi:hypothetical protein